MSGKPASVRAFVSLCAMMFLQFMLVAVWFVPLGAYLEKLQMSGTQMAWIMSSMALGCLTAPLIGMVADRHFASEKVLSALNLAAAALLLAAAQVTSPTMVFVLLLAVMLCYMPTWGLTSSIAMTHSPAEKFPLVRVFGSIGWVAASVFSLAAMQFFNVKIDGTAIPFYCGAGTALAAAGFALLLPHTPPPAKGQKASLLDVLGLRSLVLLKDFSFALFLATYILVMVPFSIYWSYCSVFLQDKGFKLITATQSIGQISEMGFMLLVPLLVARVGIKWTMALGLAVMVVRYAAFLLGGIYDAGALYLLAIAVHGLIFGFYFVGAQMYVDRKAPKELKAQAQGFLFLAGFGVGLLIGNFINGQLIDSYSAKGLAVGEGFKVAATATVSSDAALIEETSVSGVRLYKRVLDENEVKVLAAPKDKAQQLVEKLQSAGDKVDLDEGLIASGSPAELAGKQLPVPMTFAATFELPKKKSDAPVNGTLFQLGDEKNSLRFAVKDDVLAFQAGDTEILARSFELKFGRTDSGEAQPMHIAGTFDGKEIQLFAGGKLNRIYYWQPLWGITTAVSAVLLIVFAALFRDKAAQARPAEEPAAAAK